VLIKILYVILVLSVLALLWAVGACFLRVRRHLSRPRPGQTGVLEGADPERKRSQG
jgi:hypothetical protein